MNIISAMKRENDNSIMELFYVLDGSYESLSLLLNRVEGIELNSIIYYLSTDDDEMRMMLVTYSDSEANAALKAEFQDDEILEYEGSICQPIMSNDEDIVSAEISFKFYGSEMKLTYNTSDVYLSQFGAILDYPSIFLSGGSESAVNGFISNLKELCTAGEL